MLNSIAKAFKIFAILFLVVQVSSSDLHAKKKAGIGKAFKKVGKALSSIGNILDKGLKKAGLPGIGDIKRLMKGLPKLEKQVSDVKKNPSDKDKFLKLKSNETIGELIKISADCQKPTLMAAAMMPEVGSLIAAVCGQFSNMNTKIEAALDKVELQLIFDGENTSHVNIPVAASYKKTPDPDAAPAPASSTTAATSTDSTEEETPAATSTDSTEEETPATAADSTTDASS